MLLDLSANQEKLYRFQKLFFNDPSYNLTFFYKITKNLNVNRFKDSINLVYNEIDAFKINFVESNGSVFQNFQDDRKYQIEVISKSPNESIEAFNKKVFDHANTIDNTPIDISKWPAFKFFLYLSNEDESYLIISAPHILSDGFSAYLFFEMISFCYNSSLQLNNLKDHVRNFFKTNNLDTFHVNKDREKDKEFFTQELKNFDSLAIKKIKQERTFEQLLDGNILQIKISKTEINKYISIHKCSENSFWLAIYAIFLNKMIDEKQFVIGFPLPNRTKHNKNAFAYLVNTLPLVFDFNKINTFSELITYINKQIFRLLRHQSFDLNLMDNLDTRFNNYFTYYDRQLNFSLNDCLCERIYLKRKSIMAELRSTVENLQDNYLFTIETGLYFKTLDTKKIITNIINNVIKVDECKIKDINIINSNEIYKYYNKLNCYKKYHSIESIKSAFEKTAKLYPENIALYDFVSEWTYKDLDKISNKIARFLLDKTKNSNHVIISLKRNNYLIAIILAILKAKKCYVPIDLFCPPDRFQYILNDLGSTHVIAEAEVKNSYQIDDDMFILVDDLIKASKDFSDESLEIFCRPNDLAYIIYTSGSSGKPKGVKISNSNLLSLMNASRNKFDFNQYDVWTLFHSYSFDFSVWEIFGSILNGAKLIIADYNISKQPSEYYKILSKYQVTILNQTPTVFKYIIQEDLIQKEKLNLRYIIFGGEALYFPMLNDWVKNHPLEETKIINMYGITETTIHVTYHEVNYSDLKKHQSIIGKPLSNLGIYIINAERQILPTGILGEILVYGDGVSEGYINADKLTNEKFFVDFDTNQNNYLTGDLGKINENGDIEYFGRKDRQVQIRGFRVELGEIECYIYKTNLVRQCVVDFITFENDDTARLVAYFIANERYENESDIKKQLKSFLPFYMIPSFFISVEKIPMTVNGKIDLALLKKNIKITKMPLKGNTATQKTLFQMVAEVIKNSDFSLKANLLDIGVTSIDLVTIFHRIKDKFSNTNISIADLFQHTSIEKLSDHIDQYNLTDENPLEEDRSLHRKAFIKRRLPKDNIYVEK